MAIAQLLLLSIIIRALHCHDHEINVTEEEYSEYALHGAFSFYNDLNDLGVAFHLSIGLNCTFIKIKMVSPACTDHWYAIGLGGDYTFESSSEELSFSAESSDEDILDESVKMNGYAIVSVNDNGRIFETTLNNTNIATYQPSSQTNNNLRDCSVTIENCVRNVECYRDYTTDDEDNIDFNEFVLGLNPIIWAYGVHDPIIDKYTMHKFAKDSFIELEGFTYNLCGYAKDYYISTASSSSDEGVDVWMIVGIVTIALLVIVSGVFIYYCFIKRKKPEMDLGGASMIEEQGDVATPNDKEMETLNAEDENL